MTFSRTAPVAVFDSGVGGIGVLREVKKLLPHEDLLYFGDDAMAPYGERPTDEVRALVLDHAQRLLRLAKALVLACNTATAAAAQELRQHYPTIPIIGMEPAIKPALKVAPHPRILILATPTTLREAKLRTLLRLHATRAVFYKCPAPELVRLVEEGLADSPEADRYLDRILAPFSGTHRPDAVVLGCTHFPLAKDAILRHFGNDMPLFDGAVGTARELARRLAAENLLNPTEREGAVTLTSSAPHMLPLYHKLFYA
ncbi:MAG: glutamate racemase [Clostridia bacterium]|nr:glutamate racemase [Clostridia bacterium]